MSRDRTPRTPEEELLHRAKRRVGMKMGFFVHALIFTLVNIGLFVIDRANGNQGWSRFPLWGWGLGLAIHGIVTFIALQGDGVRQRMLDNEVERLRRRG